MGEDEKESKKAPTLYLIRGTEITAEVLAEMFEKMTGKKPSEEELAEARKTHEQKPED